MLFDKGNKRKEALLEATQHQTRDWAATEQALTSMRDELANLQQKKQAYLDEQEASTAKRRELNTRVNEIDG